MAKTNPVNLLLDTHILLWWLDGSSRLPQAARDAIIASPEVYVSSATAWEIGIKVAQGKLEFPGDLGEQLSLTLAVILAAFGAAAGLWWARRWFDDWLG